VKNNNDNELYFWGLNEETFQPHKAARVIGLELRNQTSSLVLLYPNGERAFVPCFIDASQPGQFLTARQAADKWGSQTVGEAFR